MVTQMPVPFAHSRARRVTISGNTVNAFIYALTAVLALSAVAMLVRPLFQPAREITRLPSIIGNVKSGAPVLDVNSINVDRARGYTTVMGEVRNASGKKLNNVEAVVEYFDADHHLLKVETALLEIASIDPDEEAPFSVQTPDISGIAAYRVRFRHLLGDGISAK